jgi:hypothetical protein
VQEAVLNPSEKSYRDYLVRHFEALQHPRGAERAIASLRSGILQYAVEYGERFEGCQLGEDGVLGDAWLAMAKGYLGLLNGECGRLDCGTLDGEIRRWAVQHGFTQQEADEL